MKQFIIPVSLVLCIAYSGFAQQVMYADVSLPVKSIETIDNSVIEVFYQMSRVKDSLAPDRIELEDMILQIGENRISKFYVYPHTNRYDSSIENVLANNAKRPPDRQIDMSRRQIVPYYQEVIYKNWPEGSVTITDIVSQDIYHYTEPTPEIQWQILPDIKTILSYSCQKAITTFRGRDYEAWFAPDIPINEGPWKFYGLPGLILKVSDTQQHYVFECVGLEQVRMPVEYVNLLCIETNREEMAKIKRREAGQPPTAGTGRVILIINSPYNAIMARPSNPIELDI